MTCNQVVKGSNAAEKIRMIGLLFLWVKINLRLKMKERSKF